MKQIIIFSALIFSTLGDKLNQYLPPRPENHNIQFQPPLLTSGAVNQPFTSASQPREQLISRQYLTPNKVSEQSSQASSPFGQSASPFGQSVSPFEQSSAPFGKSSASFGKSTGPFGQSSTLFGKSSGPFIQSSTPLEKSSSPFGQSSNSFGQKSSINGNPDRQYLTPNKPDTSGQSSNSVGLFKNPNSGSSGFNQESNQKYFAPNSQNQRPGINSQDLNSFEQSPNSYNEKSVPKGQFGGQFNGQYSGSQNKFGSKSAPIGLIRSEFNPDAGDGHYSYFYETENGITAQEEGFQKNEGKSAHGGYSYTSPEGEIISVEYTADENGFVPKGSHVPEIPKAILKSIELNKAAEARGDFNEGSYREEYFNEDVNIYTANGGFQSSDLKEKSPFNSAEKIKNKFNNFADQGTFASQANKQLTPLPRAQSPIPVFGQQNNGNNGYQYSGPAKSNNVADQGSFASQDNNKLTPVYGTTKFNVGQQNKNNNINQSPAKTNLVSQQNNFSAQPGSVPSFKPKNNGYSGSIVADQGTFASKQNNQITHFGGLQNLQNNGYQYSAPVQSPFVSQQAKPITPFGGSQTAEPLFQFSPKPQYGAPEQSSYASQNNGQFSAFPTAKDQSSLRKNGFNNQVSFPKELENGSAGQFGTVQDNQGGYKY